MMFVKLELGVSSLHIKANPDQVVKRGSDVLTAKTPPWGHTITEEDAGDDPRVCLSLLENRWGRDKPHFAT